MFIEVFGIVIALILGLIALPATRTKTLMVLSFGFYKAVDSVMSASEQEMAMIAAEEQKMLNADHELSRLKGTQANEANKLKLLEAALEEADNNLTLPTVVANPAAKSAAEAEVSSVETKVNAQKLVVDSIAKSVVVAQGNLDDAHTRLDDLKNKATTHAAKERATAAMSAATNTIEAAKGVGKDGARISKLGDKIDEKFEQANQLSLDAQGSEGQRALAAAKKEASLGDAAARAAARRAARGGDATSIGSK